MRAEGVWREEVEIGGWQGGVLPWPSSTVSTRPVPWQYSPRESGDGAWGIESGEPEEVMVGKEGMVRVIVIEGGIGGVRAEGV